MDNEHSHRSLARALLAVFCLLGLAATGYGLSLRAFYAARMPASLELGWRFWHSDEDLLGGCGVAAFSLSEATARALHEQGGRVLANMTHTENGRIVRRWRETPLEGNPSTDRYIPAGLHCAASLDPELRRAALSSLRRPGNFYSSDSSGMLIVIPSEQVVLLAYAD